MTNLFSKSLQLILPLLSLPLPLQLVGLPFLLPLLQHVRPKLHPARSREAGGHQDLEKLLFPLPPPPPHPIPPHPSPPPTPPLLCPHQHYLSLLTQQGLGPGRVLWSYPSEAPLPSSVFLSFTSFNPKPPPTSATTVSQHRYLVCWCWILQGLW